MFHSPTLRRGLPLLALLAGLTLLGGVTAADDDKDFTPLFNGKDLTGWKITLADKAKDADPAKVFMVKDGIIVVSGTPNGLVHTEKSYKNYVVRFDWKYVKAGNSGLLVHIQGDVKIWPKSVEVQGQMSDHGRIFAIGGAKFEGKLPDKKDKDKFDAARKAMTEAQKKAIKPVGEWNTTEVVCKDGEITSKINGIEIDSGKGDLKEGPFGLQSEGVEIHFRNIKIKELK